MDTTFEEAKTGDRAALEIPSSPVKKHLSVPGQAYLLTTTTLFRRPVFRDVDAARAAASVHSMKWVWRDSRVLAWVLMPDSWQALVVLGQDDELRKLIGRFKKATAQNSGNRFTTNGWLWGNGFQERALGKEVELRDTARYLITHPIRAGLVDEIGCYPYWDAIWLDPGNSLPCWPGSRRQGVLK